MLKIKLSDNFHIEREYIVSTVFKYFWNVDYEIIYENRINICLTINDKNIFIDDSFFQHAVDWWLNTESMPVLPLKHWYIDDKKITECVTDCDLPVIFGKALNNNRYFYRDNDIYIGIDILGSAFFMLTRYEEIVNKNRDNYGRFSAYYSIAYKEKFLERPIINEYLEILWHAIQCVAPELKRKQRSFKIIPTHDVDRPFEFLNLSLYQVVHSLAGDLLKRKSIKLFSNRLKSYIKFKQGNYKADCNYTFDTIMDISEANGLTSTFFFMTAQNISALDGNYSIVHPYIKNLMQDIAKRRHKIGLHPSFESFKNAELLKNNKEQLDSAIKDNLNKNFEFGARQHYLRWSCPETWQYYENAGLKFDTTLSFADHIGFRCGICYEYPVFNLLTRRQLSLIEYPLIVMECSGLDEMYMNLPHKEMYERCNNLKRYCQKYNGNFVILWHNTRFIKKEEAKLYKSIIGS